MRYLALIAIAALTTVASADPEVREDRTKCLSQIKQIHVACQIFATDHNGHYPKMLTELVPDYMPDSKIFVCPLSALKEAMGYDYFGGVTTDAPTKVIVQAKHSSANGAFRAVAYNDGACQIECTPETEANVAKLLVKDITRDDVIRLFGTPLNEHGEHHNKVFTYLFPFSREPGDKKVGFSGFEALLDDGSDKLVGWRALFKDGHVR